MHRSRAHRYKYQDLLALVAAPHAATPVLSRGIEFVDALAELYGYR